MTQNTNRQVYIETLNNFKNLLKKYIKATYGSSIKQDLRTKINQERHSVEKILNRAGAGKLLNIAPPRMVGGYTYQNVNPFNVMFDPPYGVDVITCVIDSIDETIGVIKVKEDFSLELPVQKKISKSKSLSLVDKKSVFVVHGHDNEMKEQVARFLEKMGLNAIILHEQANAGLTIIEKFEKFATTSYAIVLMTPDDIGNNIKEPEKLNPRARQNVIFELGYFFGKLGRPNVCALLKGSVERPSDYDGILYIAHDSEGGWKLLLVKELKEAGLDFDSNKIFE